jgi:hypothetical protein
VHAHGGRGNPAVTPDLVAAHAAGLIVLLGPGSDVGHAVAAGHPAQARAALAGWRDRCEVVIEIVDHRAPGDTRRAGWMLHLAREARLTAVLSNAVRYLDPANSPLAQILDAARQRAPLGSPRLAQDQRPAARNGQAHLASGAQMAVTAARSPGERGRTRTGRDQAQQRCADKLFGSWLLLVRGRLRRAGPAAAGPGAYTVNAEDCWDLRALEDLRATQGLTAARAALRPASPSPRQAPNQARPTVFPNGFALSPYAETGSPGSRPTYPSGTLWHPGEGSA